MTIAVVVCLAFALLALWDRRRLVLAGGSEPALASATASSMALVWAWAGLSMLGTYQVFLSWHEWWQYVLAGIGVATLCLLFASMMAKDAAAGRQDQTLLNLARYLTIGQLAGMLIAMVGMIIDDKMPRDPSEPDWAANAIFFFGAATLAVISANALWTPAPRRA
ncbi:MAG: hypothetical protein WC684_00500 [Hyphomicrobium sp.]